ncbi:MAG: hypothetical protein L0J17_07375 [Brevibacterium sp.]|nr:hypothetical protein [Brevibacterium sp.]MDN5909113.1 hypothetical protein [Brevibacterium sp.]MDN6175198.1 hypothetical protein [Brevibacterium sp.]
MSRPGRGLLGKGAAESVGGGLRYAKLLAQCPPAEVEATRGRNHLGADRLQSFWTHEREFRRIAGECDLDADVSHRIGPMSGHQLVRMRILELALHAADLSVGTGGEWPIDDELAEFIDTRLRGLIVKLGSSGGYAPPRSRELGSHAERVLAISGR